MKSLNGCTTRFCVDPKYSAEYIKEVIAAVAGKSRESHVFDILATFVDLDFILKNPQYNWPMESLCSRIDVTNKVIRENPQYNWPPSRVSPIRGFDPKNPRHVRVCELYLNDKLSITDITESGVIWASELIIKYSNINPNDILSYVCLSNIIPAQINKVLMPYFSMRPDIDMSVVLKYGNLNWRIGKLRMLDPYRLRNDFVLFFPRAYFYVSMYCKYGCMYE